MTEKPFSLYASDPQYQVYNEIQEDIGQLINPQCWWNVSPLSPIDQAVELSKRYEAQFKISEGETVVYQFGDGI